MRIITFNANGIRSAANKGFFDWLAHAGRRCGLPAGDQGAGGPAHRSAVPPGRPPQLLSRRDHQEGLQRRGDLFAGASRTRCAPRSAGRRSTTRAATSRRAYGNLSVVSLYVPSGSSGEDAPGLQVQGHGLAQADPRRSGSPAVATTCCAATGTSCAAAQRHQELDARTRRTPAACRPSAPGSTALLRAATQRLGRQLPRAASRRPGLHLVEQPRRRAREERRLAHRLPDRHAVAARAAARPARSTPSRAFPITRRIVVDYVA